MLEINNKAFIYQNGNLNRDRSVESNMQESEDSLDELKWGEISITNLKWLQFGHFLTFGWIFQ